MTGIINEIFELKKVPLPWHKAYAVGAQIHTSRKYDKSPRYLKDFPFRYDLESIRKRLLWVPKTQYHGLRKLRSVLVFDLFVGVSQDTLIVPFRIFERCVWYRRRTFQNMEWLMNLTPFRNKNQFSLMIWFGGIYLSTV